MDRNNIPESELRAQAVRNVLTVENESYDIPHCASYDNEYPRYDSQSVRYIGTPQNPNHMLAAFPCEYPYAMGAPDVDRPVSLSFQAHGQWALQYADHRFRHNHRYIFEVYGIMVKRQIADSSKLQIKRSNIGEVKRLFDQLTEQDFRTAADEDEKHVPNSNPAIRQFYRHLSCTRTRVMGTDESRRRIRDKIHSTNVELSPNTFWITLNPRDMSDPIAQVFAGADINLDDFEQAIGPNSTARAKSVADDPFAAAKYFFTVVNAVFEHLFGIRVTEHKITRKQGVLGTVAAYIAANEEQQRGSLHTHVLIWMEHAPTAQRMEESLKDPSFRQHLCDYLRTVIVADINHLTTAQLRSAPKSTNISFRRPTDVSLPNWSDLFHFNTNECARSLQLHKCAPNSCLVKRKGRTVCKRRAPFELSDDYDVGEDGRCHIQRYADMLNSWNPSVMDTLSSNHDIKFLTNSAPTALIAFYIAYYATKKHSNSTNISALLARRFAYARNQEKYHTDHTHENERLLQRCANGMSTQQEICAPQAAAFIMGWGDRIQSHNYEKVYMPSVFNTTAVSFKSPRAYWDHF